MQLMQKLVIVSAAALQKSFPDFMSKPLNEEHEFVKIVEEGRRLYSKATKEYETVKNFWEQEKTSYKRKEVVYDNELKPLQLVRKILMSTQLKKVDKTFKFESIFYMAFGVIEGATSAIPTSTYNFQCGKNVTNARLWTEAATTSFAAKNDAEAMANIYKVLQVTDDITINCWLGIKDAAALDTQQLTTMDGIPTNLLYNAGFMFTDILNLIYYDELSDDPYWYYLAFNMGDFLVRFIYREDD